MTTYSLGLSASATDFPDPVRRGRMATVWVIRDAAGAEVDRFPGFSAVTSPEQALERHRERVAERAAARPAIPTVAPAAARPAPAVRAVAPVRPALLYHFTTGAGLRGILRDDAIQAVTQHILNRRTVCGVSLTRDRWFDFEAHKLFRLALDPARLPGRTVPVRDAYMQNQHKAHPIDDGVMAAPTNEAEEFHIGAVRAVRGALVEIAVMEDLLDAPEADPEDLGVLSSLAARELPGVRLLAVDRRRPFGQRERPLDPTAWNAECAAPAFRR